jgi:hypothetical protein
MLTDYQLRQLSGGPPQGTVQCGVETPDRNRDKTLARNVEQV